ncbi:MAG: site-2 protease family protein [Cyanobacteria bacterium P01_D01_bin.44]
MITLLILLAAVGILVWGFVRSRPYGQLGLLAWLQSVILMVPWLLFFGLFAMGVYLNLAGVLILVVLSTGGYIWLGRQLRTLGGHAQMAQQKLAISQTLNQTDEAMTESGVPEGQTETQSDPSATQPKAPAIPIDEPAFTPIPAEDLTAIEGIFGIDTFFRTETTAYQSGAFFRGNLRGQPTETVNQLSALLEDRLGDRYRLFLIEGPERKPVVVVLPSSDDPKPATTPQKVLAVVLAIATLITSLETGGILQGFDFFQNFGRWGEALPLALGVVTVLTAHELGHRWQAQRHQVKLSWPFFFPAWQLGSFGAFTRFESLLPNRSVLFDVAFAGPAVGGLASLLLLLLGLVISHPGSYFQIPAEFFQGSVLVGSLARIVLGNALQADIVDVHPLTIVGWLGLVITALNVMPAGQLDGGRIVQAIYGRRVASRTTVVTLILLALVSLVNPLALYWAALILFLQRGLERPCLDDLSEPDDARAGLALLILFMMLATLLPLTPSLAGRLGIG